MKVRNKVTEAAVAKIKAALKSGDYNTINIGLSKKSK